MNNPNKKGPAIENPKQINHNRNQHDISSQVTPGNKEVASNIGLLSIVGSGMGGNTNSTAAQN